MVSSEFIDIARLPLPFTLCGDMLFNIIYIRVLLDSIDLDLDFEQGGRGLQYSETQKIRRSANGERNI